MFWSILCKSVQYKDEIRIYNRIHEMGSCQPAVVTLAEANPHRIGRSRLNLKVCVVNGCATFSLLKVPAPGEAQATLRKEQSVVQATGHFEHLNSDFT